MIDAEALYADHAKGLAGFITRRFDGTPEDVDDLTGEVFARVVQRSHQYRDQGLASPKSWVYQIARNLMIDTFRSAGYRTHFSLLPEHDRVDPSSSADLDAVLDRMLLVPALARLTHDQRRVVECRFLHDLSEKQTAEVTGLTYSAVKKLQARALANLRYYVRAA